MTEITAEVRAAIDRAAGDMELAGDEYIELADGLIHCKKCRGSRQTVVPRFGGSGYFMPRCLCSCQQKAQEERKAMEKQKERMERIKCRKAQGLQDRYLYDSLSPMITARIPSWRRHTPMWGIGRKHTGTIPAFCSLVTWEPGNPSLPAVLQMPCLTVTCRF